MIYVAKVGQHRKAKAPPPPLVPMERRMATAISDMLWAVRDRLPMQEMEAILASGNFDKLFSLLDLENRMHAIAQGAGVPVKGRSWNEALRDAFEYGAQQELHALDKIPVRVHKASIAATMRFDMTSQTALDWLDHYSFSLIQGISAESREAIRSILLHAFEYGGSPAEQARLIRNVVGLNTQQTKAVLNYWNMLESGDEGRMMEAINRELRDARFDGSVLRAVEEGQFLDPDKIDQMVSRYSERSLNYRAEMIARTETIRAENAGISETWRQAVEQGFLDPTDLKVWIASDDACEICLNIEDINQDGVPIGEPFDDGDGGEIDEPPFHPNCLPGHSLVASIGRIAAVSEHWYEGDMLVIRTAAGHELSCTPNHSVLSDHGWVRACLLDVGNNVVSLRRSDWEGMCDDNQQDVPTRIEEIARSFSVEGAPSFAVVPATPHDFHGDGGGSQVTVIRTNSELGDRFQAPFSEKIMQELLPFIHFSDALLCGSLGFESSERTLATENRFVGGDDLPLSLPGRHLAPPETFGLTLASDVNVVVEQESTDDTSAYAECGSNGKFGFASNVSVDKVADIRGIPLTSGDAGGSEHCLPFIGSHLLPSEGKTLLNGSYGDAVISQDLIDSAVAYPIKCSEGRPRLSRQVTLDKVINIRRVPFAGHVFNLQTTNELYIGSGVVVHNCRCSQGLAPGGMGE